jgi:hypothetical protein
VISGMKDKRISAIYRIEDLNELYELQSLTNIDLRNTEILRAKIGDNKNLDDMVDYFLDLLSAINKRIEEIKNKK